MTPLNLAKHRNSPHMAFWRMLKEGNDHFELTRAEPKVDVCDRRYVFDAQAPAGDTRPLAFNPRGKCPAYEVPQEIASAVSEKREKDQREFAALVQRGTQTVAATTGNDGGMHPTFAAKLKPSGLTDDSGRPVYGLASSSSTPALPANVNPPRNVAASFAGDSAPVAEPVVQRTGSVRTASAEPPSKNGGLFGSLFSDSGSSVSNLFGLRGNKDDVPPPPNKPPAGKLTSQAKPTPARTVVAAPARPAPPPKPTQTAEKPAEKSAEEPTSHKSTATALAPTPPAPAKSGLMAGAAPMIQSNSFESRWGSFR
jgi:hypothetical protein